MNPRKRQRRHAQEFSTIDVDVVRHANASGLASPDQLTAQRSEADAKVLSKKLRLLPRSEVGAFVVSVVVDHLRVRPLGPAARRRVDLVREDRHDHWKLDAPDIEESSGRW